MSAGVTITVFTRTSLASVTLPALADGVGERLALLTAVYCPDDEQPIDVAIARLRSAAAREPDDPRRWMLRYGRVHSAVIAVARTAKEDPATPFRRTGAEDVAYMARRYRDVEPRGLREVTQVLERAHDVVTLAMTKRAAQRMAWPIGVAAAAWLAARGDGVLFAPGSGWLVPTAKETRAAR